LSITLYDENWINSFCIVHNKCFGDLFSYYWKLPGINVSKQDGNFRPAGYATATFVLSVLQYNAQPGVWFLEEVNNAYWKKK
jgi:hypothetical protein